MGWSPCAYIRVRLFKLSSTMVLFKRVLIWRTRLMDHLHSALVPARVAASWSRTPRLGKKSLSAVASNFTERAERSLSVRLADCHLVLQVKSSASALDGAHRSLECKASKSGKSSHERGESLGATEKYTQHQACRALHVDH